MVTTLLEGALLVVIVGSGLGMLLCGSVLLAQAWDGTSPFFVWSEVPPVIAKVRAFARRGLVVSVCAFAVSSSVIWAGNALGRWS